MSHLSAERLAALADAGPTTVEEAAHLAGCADCAAERDAHRRLVALALDERTRLAPPLTDWSSIGAALRDEGMVNSGSRLSALGARQGAEVERRSQEPRAQRREPLFSRRTGLRVAAGLLIAAGGAAIGRASAGVPAMPFAVAQVAGQNLSGRALDGARAATAAGVAAGVAAGAAFVSDTAAAFRSTTEALVALARAEEQYQLAAAFLLQHDSAATMNGARSTDDPSSVYRARLVALDNVMAASREALYEAPHDPVINRYYLATLGAREATLRQLNTSLPAGARLTRY